MRAPHDITIASLSDLADDLAAGRAGTRWVGASTNQSLFWVRDDGSFVPIKLLAHVVDKNDPRASKDKSTPATVRSITGLLTAQGYEEVTCHHPQGERLYEAYIAYYRKLLPRATYERIAKRRPNFDEGQSRYYFKLALLTSSPSRLNVPQRTESQPSGLKAEVSSEAADHVRFDIQTEINAFDPSPVDLKEYWEGGATQITTNVYERSKQARIDRIAKWRSQHEGRLPCACCDYDFEEAFGALGQGFIHIHHEDPVSKRGEGSKTALCDLWPVCPNCHAMIHRRRPRPFTVEDIRRLLKKAD